MLNKKTNRQSGFTLVELMITIVIMGIALSIGVPPLVDAYRKTQVTAATTEFLSALGYARSESLNSGVAVIVCASADKSSCGGTSFKTGWIAFMDDDGDDTLDSGERILRKRGSLGNTTVTTSPATTSLTFGVGGATTQAVDFTFCRAGSSGNYAGKIKLSATGRALRITGASC
ncbi:MAG: GspH/FimT family pseudopilin [Pseudomonadales bacterium]